MIIARTFVAALFATAASAQAFSVSDGLYGREYHEYKTLANRKLADRSYNTINDIRDLAYQDKVMVLSARDPSNLAIRSEDIISHLLVVRMMEGSSPPPSPPSSPQPIYHCQTPEDCEHNIQVWSGRVTKGEAAVANAQAVFKAAHGKDEQRKAKNNLHTAQESLAESKDRVSWYKKYKEELAAKAKHPGSK
jgi:hypothetical protein